MLRAALPLLLCLAACDSAFKETETDADLGPADLAGADGDGQPDAAPPECPAPGDVKSETVDTLHEPGAYSSIAVDGAGAIHVSYYAAGPTPGPMGGEWHDARYSVWRGGAWQSEDIYTPGVVGGYTALGLDPTGKVHVVFYDWGQRDLIHAWRESQGWKPAAPLSTTYNDGWGNDLAVDPSGTVHVITFKGAEGQIDGEWHYLRRVATKWDAPVVLHAPAGGQGPKSGIAVDDKGTVHVSFCDHNGELRHRSGTAGSFTPALILDTGLGELCASDIALDSDGQAQISYHDSASKTLKLVGQSGGTFGAPVTLDSSGDVGRNNAVAAGPSGDLWVAYYDATNLDLKVIRRQAGSWGQPKTVDSAGEVGRYVSAAVGPGGELHASHYDMGNKALRHTRVCP